MKIRMADYVANFLVENGVTDVFSVVGGGAMHLNDAIGHHENLKVTYNHHEQACAIAAEAYSRLENKIAAVCVTTGPGGTNALTGVTGFKPDSYSKERFMQYYLGFSIPFASEAEQEEIASTEAYAAMPAYPYYGSMQKFGDILVVKLS